MHTSARADKRWWLVLFLLAAVYTFINLGLSLVPGGPFFRTYILQPLLWLAVGLTVIVFGRYRPEARSGRRRTIIQLALVAGVFQIVFYGIGGLFTGFGRSPYGFTAGAVAGNLFYVAGTLAGLEITRAWLMNHAGRRTFPALAVTALLFAVLLLPLRQLTGLQASSSSISYIGSTLLPALAASLLASYLVRLAGPLASIAYLGVIQLFWWFLPVLPDLSWSIEGLIGTAVPIIALAVIRSYYASKTEHRRAHRQAEESLGGWVITSVVSVILIWFAVGIFPIRPSLVGSGSMVPALEVGDITIVVKTPVELIKVGDIIDYKLAKGVDIVHRVIAIEEQDSGMVFITKGDANNAEDEDPVLPDNIIGKVVFTARKVGWVAVALKSLFSR